MLVYRNTDGLLSSTHGDNPNRATGCEITAEWLRSVLDYDPESGIFRWKHCPAASRAWNGKFAGRVAGSPDRKGYTLIMVRNKRMFAHRLAWLWVYGEMPPDQIDHRDRVKSNNAISNLRLATGLENARNKGKPLKKSTFPKGVEFFPNTGRWRARLWVGGKGRHLGYFDSADEAEEAYLAAAKEQHGEFFPSYTACPADQARAVMGKPSRPARRIG